VGFTLKKKRIAKTNFLATAIASVARNFLGALLPKKGTIK